MNIRDAMKVNSMTVIVFEVFTYRPRFHVDLRRLDDIAWPILTLASIVPHITFIARGAITGSE